MLAICELYSTKYSLPALTLRNICALHKVNTFPLIKTQHFDREMTKILQVYRPDTYGELRGHPKAHQIVRTDQPNPKIFSQTVSLVARALEQIQILIAI